MLERGVFVAAVFASAFLIFGVQPMVGKHILPWFGGAPSVWMLCLAFYQTALFAGYAWAFCLSARVAPRLQPLAHGALFLASLAVLPVLPGAEWKPEAGADSSLRILAMLAANVMLPFVLLAATGPLLQLWFARALPGRSPYPLYAVSNLGSLLGLVSFPFLVEPSLPLSVQSRLWSWGFAACGIAVLACAVQAARAAPNPGAAAAGPAPAELRKGDVALWILLPAAAVVTFMGVTNRLCLEVASIPFLWIAPLSIYLATLVLCFGSERLYRRGPFLTLAVASLAWLVVAGDPALSARLGLAAHDSVGASIVRYCAALFFGCMVAHGELHRLRPGPARLTAFYLCVAGGGALGGLFVGLVAPRIFDAYHELPLGVAACWALTLVAIARAPSGLFAGRLRAAAWAALALVTAGALGGFALGAGRVEPGTLATRRTFFGILRVVETPGRTPFVVLRHGTTRHGYQYRDAGLRERPTSYYGPTTGVGLLLADRLGAHAVPARIGIVGLGVGTLAAYGRTGDEIVFYEIDPQVVRIARDSGHFSYLADSAAAVEIVMGDARLSLERELAERGGRAFDVLVVDAFTSDSVPLHLLTEEAFRTYAAHLAGGGVLAVHVSNRNFDLTTPVARLGRELGLSAFLVVNRAAPQLLAETSRWVVLAPAPAQLAALEAQAARFPTPQGQPLIRVFALEPEWIARAALWTDDFSNVMPLLRLSDGLQPLACGAACR
jgi:spermidine synthase